MQAIEVRGVISKYVNDPLRVIPETHLNNVCKLQCGEKTCKYIMITKKGFICVKKTPLKVVLDDLAKEGSITSRGDNCPGLAGSKETNG